MKRQKTTYQLDPESLLTVSTKPWEASWMARPVYSIDGLVFDATTSYGHLRALDLLNLFLQDIQKGSFVSFRTAASNHSLIHALEKTGFLLIETSLSMVNPDIGEHLETVSSSTQIHLCTEAEIDRVMEIASVSFSHDRFHSDPNIPNSMAGKSRALWVQNALDDPEKELAIASVGDEVCGFNCTKHKGDQVIVDLIGIDRAFRGRGIGSQLVTRMFADAMAKGIHKSRVGTQAHNVQSVKFYQKHGYSLSDSYCTFHLHL